MKKVLVANRGEIALRIMRSLSEMSIKSVAVYSEADRNSPHVRYADEAICLGPPPSNESYLLMDKIVSESIRLGVDGIHPGYGFLAENADFARKVKEASIIFIGPSPRAIEIMGSKLAAKEAVASYNIPMVPGTDKAVTDPKEAEKIAAEIGYPILIKAAAGGGGKGMRIVDKPEEVASQMERAISEATSAFGDGSVFIEKYIRSPRHIEIQVLADNHGNTIHLFERECSIQRRHQKVIEEAPSCVLNEDLRAEMGACAIRVAEACSYSGAGTVEFLIDAEHNFYFLEMNTRLQVEHPVTEMITGVDLVKEQINVARGEKLKIKQSDLKIQGHAIELRVYAEDPCNNFLPDIGQLKTYKRPSGTGIRVDDGFEEGMSIPIYYDPMIAKLAVHATSRDEAIERMKRAIADYKISGIANTLSFGTFVMEHQSFIQGNFDTHFVKNHFLPEHLSKENKEEAFIASLLAVNLLSQRSIQKPESASHSNSKKSWKDRRHI